jgi:hypothetical protein
MFLDHDWLELAVTAGALGLGGGLAALAGYLERRPRASFKPRLLPTTPLMFAGVLISMLAIVHLVNLLGVRTGR